MLLKKNIDCKCQRDITLILKTRSLVTCLLRSTISNIFLLFIQMLSKR